MEDDDDSLHVGSERENTYGRASPAPPFRYRSGLLVIYGADLGKKHDLPEGAIVIGRSSKSDIHLDQESVSRSHSKVVNNGDTIVLSDMGSTNGTYVNDEPITEYTLRDGDLIKIGRTILKFLTARNIENLYHEEMHRLTTVDGLTNVYNKRYLTDTLGKDISRAHSHRTELTLVMFDIDYFKKVNDRYGHQAGDHVLTNLCKRVKQFVKNKEYLARYGGEEFALVLPEVDTRAGALYADQIRCGVEVAAFEFKGERIPVTISMGVAALTPTVFDTTGLIEAADAALYKAKKDGRNRVVVFPKTSVPRNIGGSVAPTYVSPDPPGNVDRRERSDRRTTLSFNTLRRRSLYDAARRTLGRIVSVVRGMHGGDRR